MEIYCTQEFIDEFLKIKKKKQYKDLENLFLDFFLNNNFELIANGDRLYGPDNIPFLKKRLPDAGGYRLYYLADVSVEKIILNFVHPKKQPLGYPNIGPEKKKNLHDSVLICRRDSSGLFKLSRCPVNQTAVFTSHNKY